MKLLVLTHALLDIHSQKRWRDLAKCENINVQLVLPKKWVVNWFGNRNTYFIQSENDKYFSIKATKTTNDSNFSMYFFLGLKRVIQNFKPTIIYPTHESNQTIQMVFSRWLYYPKAKLIFFTMSEHVRTAPPLSFSPRHLIGYCWRRTAWWLLCNGTDAAICHYPAIKEQLIKEGYKKPILIQTQIGVDETIFKPNKSKVINLNKSFNFDSYIIGFVGRVISDKGIWDIANTMNHLPSNIKLAIVGGGEELEKVKEFSIVNGWSERLIIYGQVSTNKVAQIMQELDCLFIGSRESDGWVDTFPNVVAQAMATGIPVIGSNSGAIPYLLGGKGLIYEPGKISEIVNHITTLIESPSLSHNIGISLRQRALEEFCTEGLNRNFIKFVDKL